MLNTTVGLSMPGGSEWLMVIVGVLLFYYWIKTLVEVINRKFADNLTKILWLVVVFAFGIIGAAVYNFWGREVRTQA